MEERRVEYHAMLPWSCWCFVVAGSLSSVTAAHPNGHHESWGPATRTNANFRHRCRFKVAATHPSVVNTCVCVRHRCHLTIACLALLYI